MQKNTRYPLYALAALALIFIGGLLLYFGPAAKMNREADAAQTVLLAFGEKLKNVPLQGDESTVTKAIEENYAPYVTEELLADWKANHEHAPGRLTSSPWPDHLGVASVSEQGAGILMSGEVVLKTSAENSAEGADTIPYVALLISTDSGWKIAAYQEEKVQTLKNIPTTDEDIPGAR